MKSVSWDLFKVSRGYPGHHRQGIADNWPVRGDEIARFAYLGPRRIVATGGI